MMQVDEYFYYIVACYGITLVLLLWLSYSTIKKYKNTKEQLVKLKAEKAKSES